ncbi:hypothetical protein RCO48_31555 [Peribacillus frigoritolerans]|nr:hypothetical protein [Peribacillus frigoritolerans]
MKKFLGMLLSIIILFFTLSGPVTAKTTSLSDANALKIADNASKHFWNALHGYKSRSCSQKNFQL